MAADAVVHLAGCTLEECGKGCVALEKLRSEMIAEISTSRSERSIAMEGVSNFRKFQADVKGKISFIHGAVWVAGIVSLIAGGILAYLATLIVPAVKIVLDDYYSHHPQAKDPHKGIMQPLDRLYTVHLNPPQDTAIPAIIENYFNH